MIKRIVPALFAAALVQSISAHAAELTDEQRAAIAERISPVGDVCLQGENCGGLPNPETSAKPASMVASSGSGQGSGSSSAASGQGSGGSDAGSGDQGGDNSADEAVASSDASGAAGPGEGASNVAVAAADGASSIDGEAIYNQACMACHASGVGGAPMVGDVDAWSPRIAKGMEALHQSGIQGVAGTAMMAKGGRMDLSDQEVMAAVDYMVESSQ